MASLFATYIRLRVALARSYHRANELRERVHNLQPWIHRVARDIVAANVGIAGKRRKRSSTSAVSFLLIVVPLLIASGAARAQEQPVSQQFSRAYQAGQDAYNLGKLDRARSQFERARDFEPSLPGPHRWLAQVALAQDRFEDCLAEAIAALELAPQSPQAPAVRAIHAQCRDRLGRPPFTGDYAAGGALAVTANVDGAQVRVNGLAYGATPMDPRAIAVGDVEVGLERSGYLPATTTAKIYEGVVTDVAVELAADPNAATDPDVIAVRSTEDIQDGWVELVGLPAHATIAVDGQPAARDERGRIEASSGIHSIEVSSASYEPWRRRVRFYRGQTRRIEVELRTVVARQRQRRRGYISLGTAAAFAALGATFGILEHRARDEARDLWRIETSRPSNVPLASTADIEPVRSREDLREVVSRGKRYRLISGAAFGAAAVALGTSIYFFIQERPAAQEGVPAPLVLTPIVPAPGELASFGATVTYTTELDW